LALRYSTRKTVRAGLVECVECLLRADRFLSRSKYVEKVEQVSPGVYHVRFVWRKLGVSRRYDVVFRVSREGNKIIYESLEGSKYPMRFEFRLRSKDGESALEANASMRAGFMADLFGRRDFAEFVDELVETGFVRLVQEYSKRAGRPIAGKPSCLSCILYDPERRYCYYLRSGVKDPGKPPCSGKQYLPIPR